MFWGYLKGVKKPGTSELAFGLLFSVAEVVMSIPHSNAGEEKIFSFVNKNKTPSRSLLKLEGTLSSSKPIIRYPLTWKSCRVIIEKAKLATRTYNEEHKSIFKFLLQVLYCHNV